MDAAVVGMGPRFGTPGISTERSSTDATIANNQELIDTVCQTESLITEKDSIGRELSMMAKHLNNLIRENARIAQD